MPPFTTALVALAVAVATSAPAPAPPTQATQALMLAIADGRRPLASFVDDDAGVVFIDDQSSAREDAPPHPPPRRLCGDELTTFTAAWQRTLRSEVRHDRDRGLLECRNRPGPPTCSFSELVDEWSDTVHVIFRLDPARGLRLVAIVVDDENAVDRTARHRRQARTIARLTRSRCPLSDDFR